MHEHQREARCYDPATSRFINADSYVSTGQGLLGYNMYAYCKNDPIRYVDPTGTIAVEAVVWGLVLAFAWLVSSLFLSLPVTTSDTPSLGSIGSAESDIDRAKLDFVDSSTKNIAVSKAEEKTDIVPPTNEGTVYYHITTPENAASIMASGIMYGSVWEGGDVCAWRSMPNKYAIENSGVHTGTVIAFKTNAAFYNDPGINDPCVKACQPVRTSGPIIVWDVQIVE